jgi:hypothetical protein
MNLDTQDPPLLEACLGSCMRIKIIRIHLALFNPDLDIIYRS